MKAKRIKISVSTDFFFFQLNSTEINQTSFFEKILSFCIFFSNYIYKYIFIKTQKDVTTMHKINNKNK